MKRRAVTAFVIVVISLASMAFSPGWGGASGSRILIGPFTSWRSCADVSACSVFGATSFLREPIGKYLSMEGRYQIALHVDVYHDGSLIGSADGVGAIRLAESPFPQEPAGYASIGSVNAVWDQPIPDGPFTAEAHLTVMLLGANGRILGSDTRVELFTVGGG
jgi:hypothetical protein